MGQKVTLHGTDQGLRVFGFGKVAGDGGYRMTLELKVCVSLWSGEHWSQLLLQMRKGNELGSLEVMGCVVLDGMEGFGGR